MTARLFLPIAALAAVLVACPPAAAQSNLDTVKGPNPGEETTLTMTPYQVTDNVSVRAMGVSGPNHNRWALTLIGAAPEDSISLMRGEESLPIEDVDRPEGGEVGPVTIFVSEETFLTIAETEGVQLQVGDEAEPFPEELRRDMRMIFREVT